MAVEKINEYRALIISKEILLHEAKDYASTIESFKQRAAKKASESMALKMVCKRVSANPEIVDSLINDRDSDEKIAYRIIANNKDKLDKCLELIGEYDKLLAEYK